MTTLIRLTMVAGFAALLSAPVVHSAPPANKVWKDASFGYALELPDTWGYRVTPAKDYLFEGPKGTEAYELSIILQFVAKSANPKATAASQLQGLVADLERGAKAVVKRRDTIQLGGVAAPFVTVTYQAKNSAGQVVPFAHTQLAAEHGAYVYLISYSGPVKIYEANVGVFEHLLETFMFTKLEAPPGIEPGMELLQSSALPLGDGAF